MSESLQHPDDQGAGNKDYYGWLNEIATGLQFRVDPKLEISAVLDTLKGIIRDQYDRVIAREDPVSNNLGIQAARQWLTANITKTTHLSKYENEERVNRQAKDIFKKWIKEVVKNRKRWGVKSIIIMTTPIEKLIYESMLRANDGFEAQLTAKQHQVIEQFQHDETSGGRGGGRGPLGWLRRGRGNEWQS